MAAARVLGRARVYLRRGRPVRQEAVLSSYWNRLRLHVGSLFSGVLISTAAVLPAHAQPIDFASPAQEADWSLIETLARTKGGYDHCFSVLAKDSSDPMLAAIGKSAAHIAVLTEAYIRKYAIPGPTVQRPALFGFVTWNRVFENIDQGKKERERLGLIQAECSVVRDDALYRASRLKD